MLISEDQQCVWLVIEDQHPFYFSSSKETVLIVWSPHQLHQRQLYLGTGRHVPLKSHRDPLNQQAWKWGPGICVLKSEDHQLGLLCSLYAKSGL